MKAPGRSYCMHGAETVFGGCTCERFRARRGKRRGGVRSCACGHEEPKHAEPGEVRPARLRTLELVVPARGNELAAAPHLFEGSPT